MKLLKDYTAPDFSIEKIHLHIELNEQDTLVRSELVIKRNNAMDRLVLEGEEQTLVSIILNDKPLSSSDYEVTDKQLIIFSVPGVARLTIASIIQPQNNTALSGLYRSKGIFCTQCEAQGFRRITYYLDRPDVMSFFTTTIIADKKRYPVLLSNGNKIDSGDWDDTRHWVTWQDPFKKPAYLFALVAGDLEYIQDHYMTRSNRRVELIIYVEPQYSKEHCEFAMDALKKAMHWDEQKYDLEYDLDIYMIVAVSDFNMGAMENKGLNIFNAKYVLADQKIATDVDFQGVLRVIGHEYFHNWTGNRVTLRDWFQLSLKEGLTVFREQQFFEDHNSVVVSRIQEVRLLRTRQFAEDSGPLAHPIRPESYIEIDNFYTATVYEKGSEVIRMIHTLLGEEKFKKGLALYFKRHDGQAVTTDDFVSAFSDAHGIDLTQFKRWYTQAGTPQVNVTSHYDPKTQVFSLICEQYGEPTSDGSPKEPWVIPVAFQLMTQNGEPINLDKNVDKTILVLDKSSQIFSFDNIKSEPVPSLLRHFSAPVKLAYPYSDEQLAILIAHDTDLFNRWNACVELFTRCVDKLESVEVLIKALSHLLSEALSGDLHDKAFLAEMLNFPSFAYLVEQKNSQEKIDIRSLLQARDQVVTRIVDELYDLLLGNYNQSSEETPDARALRNMCLYLLSCSHNTDIQELVEKSAAMQYEKAQNMTEKMGALEAIKNEPGPLRERLLSSFYDEYQSYPLVVTKWFGLHARSKIPSAIENIKALMKHPAFNILTPNHVYALINEFQRGNPDYFHEESKGYDFIADCVIELDPKNSNVAAHLVESLLLWKRLTQPQSQWMHSALEKIKSQPVLSNAVLEVVNKALYA